MEASQVDVDLWFSFTESWENFTPVLIIDIADLELEMFLFLLFILDILSVILLLMRVLYLHVIFGVW